MIVTVNVKVLLEFSVVFIIVLVVSLCTWTNKDLGHELEPQP